MLKDILSVMGIWCVVNIWVVVFFLSIGIVVKKLFF